MASLPWLGLGLSTNLGPRDVPDPYRLLAEWPELFDFVEYSAPLSLAEARELPGRFATLFARRREIPAVFHPVQLNLWGPEAETEEALAQLAEHCAAVGTPWVGNDVAWWHHRGQVFPGYLYLPPPFDEEALRECAGHAAAIARRLPVPLLVENPTVLAVRGPLHVLDFMAGIAERAGVDLLLDVGHLWAYQLAAGLPADAGFERFPFERVVEIHVAGGVVARRGGRTFYLDDHPQPVRDEVLSLLAAVLPRCSRLRAVTFEGDGHGAAAARITLERLRFLVPRNREGEVVAATPRMPAEVPGGARAWESFDECFGTRAAAEDPEGTAMERDYRGAVLAERLDRSFPLSRLLLAGTPGALDSFAASPEFRALFDGTGRTLVSAFSAWARRRLAPPRPDCPGTSTPEQGTPASAAQTTAAPLDPTSATARGSIPGAAGRPANPADVSNSRAAAEAAIALESWAHGLASRTGPPAPQTRGVSLSPGVATGVFPLDPGEALHAARALRRHLAGRAWATGQLDFAGFEALAQAVARAPRTPTPVAVRAGARLEVVPLDPPLAAVLAAARRGEPWERFSTRSDLDPRAIERAVALGLLDPGPAPGEGPESPSDGR
jgi:uncharacterized protein (UPF0276 family)